MKTETLDNAVDQAVALGGARIALRLKWLRLLENDSYDDDFGYDAFTVVILNRGPVSE